MPTHLKNWLGRALLGVAVTAGAVTAVGPAAQAAPQAGSVVAPDSRSHVASVAADAPAVLGRAAHVIDAKTGKVYFSKKADLRTPVASITKVMTAYTVLKQAKPTDVVKVTAEDVRYASRGGASVAYLRAGDRLTVENLLYALMLPSGADAAHALARTYGPGVDGFTAKMNAHARELGMKDTLYVNADGMPAKGGGYSTARDQVRLAQAALDNGTIRKVSSTRYRSVPKTAEHRAYSWRNTNRLLGTPGTVGLKTGFTRAAGYTLAFAADRDGRRLVGVILGETSSSRRFQTAQALLDWAAASRQV
ncbi:D-alanyl-D-alanine carboxypeptidase family protein [Nonomuraea africana]|uniref:D-alanyl-D-alanine carboxypeptidase (Penicillin-binding protein 5/6) n=1 Tax=Nonomuraea africana TaxID=46171 RepID=A0ABR9KDU0_9ACTN|nr:D-alanyl-D-alanine carboxypeptidase family protein [Nonomuraea africana]MBE1560191.1 D-alanyl-D-alanine carboxypeptidase (penicillin-binding protein 5/6) [Nonomuraea africana]